jgi:protein tyrosine/serine phosphatase
VTDRLVPLDGPANFRDLGGYETDHGKRVRSGLVFRSDSLSFMSEEDVRHVTEVLGLRTVIDLRAGKEVEQFTHGPLESLPVTVWHMPIVDETRNDASAWANGEIVSLDDLYLMMLERFGHRFVAVLDIIAAGDTQPVVFHCAAGKDRTGVLAALVLDAVGVEREAIVADFALTNERLERVGARLRRMPTYANYTGALSNKDMSADPQTMTDVLAALDDRDGGAAGWLLANGLTDAELAALTAALTG